MKISFQQFNTKILKPQFFIYCISGDEPVLAEEMVETLLYYFKAENYFIHRRTLSKDFSFQHLLNELKNFSLFEPKKIFIVNSEQIQWIKAFEMDFKKCIENPPLDTLFILKLPRLEKSQQNSIWLKCIERQGLHIPLWPLNESQFLQWLKNKITQEQVQIAPEAILLLAEKTEGNVLAAKQELEKLKNQFSDRWIQIEDLLQTIYTQGQANIFEFVKNCLCGHTKKILRQLDFLKFEDIEPLALIGALSYEIRNLLKYAQSKNSNFSYQSENYRLALKRHSTIDFWWMQLSQASRIDQQIKSATVYPKILIWDEMTQLALTIAMA